MQHVGRLHGGRVPLGRHLDAALYATLRHGDAVPGRLGVRRCGGPSGLPSAPNRGLQRVAVVPGLAGGGDVLRYFTCAGSSTREEQMTLRQITLGILVAAAVAACGGPQQDDHDAGTDDAAVVDDSGTDAAVVESCTTIGATRVGPCGTRCGMASQQCSTAMVWENTSACIMEGECSAGTSETRLTDRCAEETRLCTSTCTWSAWAMSMPERGTCVRGTRQFVMGGACTAPAGTYAICDDTCEFVPEASATCTDGCGDSARTTPDWAREVCVPAGPFIRGTDDPSRPTQETPAAEIVLSAFYVDVFPVTSRRFHECVVAGACPFGDMYVDFLHLDHPLENVPLDFAQGFCAWDGDRRLLTDAEYAKALRGPAPRDNIYPWDGTTYRCDLLDSVECTWVDSDPSHVQDERYDATPGTRSFYGTERQYGVGFEWISDYYDPLYYASSESRVLDPQGAPTTALYGTYRGNYVRQGSASWVTERYPSDPPASVGFRCARSIVGGP